MSTAFGQKHHAVPSTSSVSSTSTATAPPITYPYPTIEALSTTSTLLPTLSPRDQLNWTHDVIRVMDRQLYPSGQPTDFCIDVKAPTTMSLTNNMRGLLEKAIPIIISLTKDPTPSIASLALYLRGKLQANGSCPDYLPKDPRQAFKDFEAAARGGEMRGWFRLGRDYEGVGDLTRARDCFNRGVKKGDCECTYRMGMAHLLGQLLLSPNPSIAIPLLRSAAASANIDVPHPAYVYGMILSGELLLPPSLPPIPSSLVIPPAAPPSDALANQQNQAREAIERSAYLCHPPAQYKLGFLYEHASLGLVYDPLMSVQWYSLASQGGELEADMALSKWFLCGAEGCFDKNEGLARTFAEKSARKAHPNGCFAMGYYFELGIGGRRDNEQARKWYQRAAKLNNPDAIARLAALSAPTPAPISIREHESRLNDTLVRRRTETKIRSDRQSILHPPPQGRAKRRGRDEERIKQEAQKAAQQMPPSMPSMGQVFMSPRPDTGGGGGGYGQMISSPKPRIGEIMSPGAFHPAMMPTTNSFPRPPIPHHAFSSGSTDTTGSLPSISDNRRREEAARKKMDSGPQTFAEMGFVSKPVEDEGCVIM